MKQISTFLLMSVLAVIIASCSTSQNTVGGSLQKRKYTKGFYHNKKQAFRSTREDVTVAPAAEVIRPEAVEAPETPELAVVTEPTIARPAAPEYTAVVSDQNTERGAQQKQEAHQKTPAKKKAAPNTKPQQKPAPVRPRRERENEYFIPLKDKKAIFQQKHNYHSSADDMLILAVIFAILIPPVGVAIYEGFTTRFWISLLLTLLFFVPGMIYALLVVCGVI